MSKMYGFTGKLSGKMGSAVFRIRGGEQIVTQYNPVVNNPRTTAQTNNRAIFTLAVQLAKVFADCLGGFIIKTRKTKKTRGAMTPRNLFTMINYPLITIPNDSEKAVIPMAQVKLTDSSTFFAPASRLSVSLVQGQLTAGVRDMNEAVTAVQFVVVDYMNNQPIVIQTAVIDAVGGTAQLDVMGNSANRKTVLAYGIIESDKLNRTKFDDLNSPVHAAPYIAQVVIDSELRANLADVTETLGVDWTPQA